MSLERLLAEDLDTICADAADENSPRCRARACW
jgi:hypothetical protein